MRQDFPGGPVVKNLPASAKDMSLVPGRGRFPHATEQLGSCTTATEPTGLKEEPACSSKDLAQLKIKIN